MPRPLAAAFVALVSCACPSPPSTPPPPDAGVSSSACAEACGPDETCDEASHACVLALPSKCNAAAAAWAPGTKAFTEVSAAWGLTGDVADGTRISAADLDGDGWEDLVVRRAGNHRDGENNGTRAVWVLHNAHDHFEDVTAQSKLLTNRTDTSSLGRPAEVILFADVDNDGDLDAYTGASASAVETSEVMLNDGTGVFSLGPVASDIRKTNDSIGGASFVDVNRDGNVDLWVGGSVVGNVGSQDHLYLGDGTGAFYDLTDAAGLTTKSWASISDLNAGLAHTVSWGTAACDLNGDGEPELLSSSYGRAPNHLWVGLGKQDGFVRFENRSVASGYAFDSRQDWSDNESARCWCKFHPSDIGCAGVPPPQYIVCNSDADAFRWNHTYDRDLFRLGGNTGTTVCGDVNGDGALDLLNLEIAHWDVGSSSDPSELLMNSKDAHVRFTRPGNDVTGLVRPHQVPWDDGDITGALFDFDGDGRLDVYIGSTDYPGTRAWLYHQKADGTFEAVPLVDGIDHRRSHGIAVADFDHDGDLDVVVGHSRARCSTTVPDCYPDPHVRMYRNELGGQQNWLRLTLEGAGANRSAIGARVTVKTAERTQTFEVGGGHGHYGIQHELAVFAGLGAACEAEVTVRWPDGALTEQTFKVPANYELKLRQGGRPAR